MPLCLFKSVQLFGGRTDGFLEVFLLLREKLCVGGIELQQAFNILQLRLRGFYRAVDLFQSLLKPRGIAADLDSDAFYPACQISHLLKMGIKIAPVKLMTDAVIFFTCFIFFL